MTELAAVLFARCAENVSMLGGPTVMPRTARTAGARHREVDSRCVIHPYTRAALMRDLRHLAAASAPDLEAWLDWCDLEGKTEYTLYQYGRACARLMVAHPEHTISDFTADEVNAALLRVPKGSRHIIRSIWNGWFKWAELQGRIDRSPMGRVARPRRPQRTPKDTFTAAEISLLEGLPLPDGPLWTILFGTGARRGDARRLQRRHVDLERGRVTFLHGKRDKSAVIPVTLHVLQAVAELDLFEQLGPEDHLWYLRRFKVGHPRRRRDPIGDSTFEDWYKHGIEAAGVRYLSPHKCRHTYGHWLKRQRGADDGPLLDLEDRAFMMRHKSVNTTAKDYPAVGIEDLERKLALLPENSPSPTLEIPAETPYRSSLYRPNRR